MSDRSGFDVVLETAFGNITVRLEADRAPVTVGNFLHYVDGGFYDGGRFHRTVRRDNNANANLKAEAIGAGIDGSAPPVEGRSGGVSKGADRARLPNDAIVIEVIQGGIDPARAAGQSPAIALERTRDTGLRHRDGTISMARLTPDSAVSDFFICIGDQPELDFGGQRNPDRQGFAAFGQVVAGMDVVRAIQAAPSNGQALDPLVTITSARRTTG